MKYKFNWSFLRQGSDVSTPSSCAGVIKTNTELAKEAGKGKTNTKVAALGNAIAATPDSVTCSVAEKASLKEQVTLLDAIVAAILAFVSELKEAIKVRQEFPFFSLFYFCWQKIFL